MSGEDELDLKALENFLVANRDLERLEVLLDRFNIQSGYERVTFE